MTKKIIHILCFLILTSTAFSEKYFTRTGRIEFVSETALLTLEATNNQVISFLNTKTGELIFGMLMKSFKFDEALAEEHFNENYVESDKYPKAKFKGKIKNFEKIDLSKNGTYNVIVAGKLTIHGVTNTVEAKGSLEIKNGLIKANSRFWILLKDYKITVPKIVQNKVAQKIPITISISYKKYKK